MKFSDSNLEKYISTFFGFGNTNSDFFHIGKEEAGEAEDIDARLRAWAIHDSPPILDNYQFHSEFAKQKGTPNCYSKLFNENTNSLQRTWMGQIKLQSVVETNELPTIEKLKGIQSKKFGRADSNNAILELFPLPAPNHDKHNYQTFSNLPFLKNKTIYKTTIVNDRIQFLNHLIFSKKPKFVIFYSTGKEFIGYWKKIAGGLDFKKRETISGREKRSRYLLLDKKDGVTFGITQHPTYTGTSDCELLETGRLIKKFSEQ